MFVSFTIRSCLTTTTLTLNIFCSVVVMFRSVTSVHIDLKLARFAPSIREQAFLPWSLRRLTVGSHSPIYNTVVSKFRLTMLNVHLPPLQSQCRVSQSSIHNTKKCTHPWIPIRHILPQPILKPRLPPLHKRPRPFLRIPRTRSLHKHPRIQQMLLLDAIAAVPQ